MHTSQAIVVGAALFATTVACTDSSGSNPRPSTADDIEAFEQLSVDVGAAATAYRAEVTGSEMAAVETCREIHDQYDADVRTLVGQMGDMSGALDTFMGAHGGGDRADVSCVAADMLSEIDRHHAVACQLADLSADQSEAVHHADVMTSYTAHSMQRSEQMMRALDGMGGGFGAMMSGCEDWDTASMMHRHGDP